MKMNKILSLILKIIIFVLLTIITQVGGGIFILSLLMSKKWKKEIKFKGIIVFSALYLLATFLIVPLLASLFGREKIQDSQWLRPTNYMTVVLNRNYVKPAFNDVLKEISHNLGEEGIQLRYLDANFPFWDGFPLLPHLSHSDGKKLDLSFVYIDSEGKLTNKKKAISGYGVFEEPSILEYNQTYKCLKKGHWQYDFTKYLTFGSINNSLQFSEKYNKRVLLAIIQNKKIKRIFIEPHLKTRLGITSSKVRFHGCQAVRHDDHIHIEIY